MDSQERHDDTDPWMGDVSYILESHGAPLPEEPIPSEVWDHVRKRVLRSGKLSTRVCNIVTGLFGKIDR